MHWCYGKFWKICKRGKVHMKAFLIRKFVNLKFRYDLSIVEHLNDLQDMVKSVE